GPAWKVPIRLPGSAPAQTAAPGPCSSCRSRPATPWATQPRRWAGVSSSDAAASASSASSRWSAERKRKARSTAAAPRGSRASRAASAAASTAPAAPDNPAPTRHVRVSGLMERSLRLTLPGACPAALAAGGLFLGCRAALARVAPGRARAGLLPAAARRAGRVRDPRGTFLRHPLFLELLVLLLVLDARPLVRHRFFLPSVLRDLLDQLAGLLR